MSVAMPWSATQARTVLRSCGPVIWNANIVPDIFSAFFEILLRPLADQAAANPEVPPQLPQTLHHAERLRLLAGRILRDELLAFLHEQMHRRRRRLLPVEESIGERADEALLLGWNELADVEHERQAAVDDEIGDQVTGVRLERQVTVQPAEDDDLEGLAALLCRHAQRTPDADRVERADLGAGLEHQFGQLHGAVRLPAAGTPEPTQLLRDGVEREREALGEF